jgi:hypothetical protein
MSVSQNATFNACRQPPTSEPPRLGRSRTWRRWVDAFEDAPDDVARKLGATERRLP